MGVNRGPSKDVAGWTPRLGRAGVSGTRICGACRAARGICMCAREKCICTRNQSPSFAGQARAPRGAAASRAPACRHDCARARAWFGGVATRARADGRVARRGADVRHARAAFAMLCEVGAGGALRVQSRCDLCVCSVLRARGSAGSAWYGTGCVSGPGLCARFACGRAPRAPLTFGASRERRMLTMGVVNKGFF